MRKKGKIIFKNNLLLLTTSTGTVNAYGYDSVKKEVLVQGKEKDYKLPIWAVSLASQFALAATAGLPNL